MVPALKLVIPENRQEYLTNLKNELIEMIKNSASSVPTGLIAMFSGTTMK